jgi:hypothetical protein
MTDCGADTFVRENQRYRCCLHADSSVRATRASKETDQ